MERALARERVAMHGSGGSQEAEKDRVIYTIPPRRSLQGVLSAQQRG